MVARFASKYRSHRVVIEPARQVRDEAGRVVDYTPGRDIVFVDHIYETEDPDEIAALRKLVGGDIIEITGVVASVTPHQVEVVRAATAAPPTSGRSHRCEHCGKAFGSAQALAIHRTRAHGAAEAAPAAAEAEAGA